MTKAREQLEWMKLTWLMTRVAVTMISMTLPQAVVNSQPANTTDFIDDGAYTPSTYMSLSSIIRQVNFDEGICVLQKHMLLTAMH